MSLKAFSAEHNYNEGYTDYFPLTLLRIYTNVMIFFLIAGGNLQF